MTEAPREHLVNVYIVQSGYTLFPLLYDTNPFLLSFLGELATLAVHSSVILKHASTAHVYPATT